MNVKNDTVLFPLIQNEVSLKKYPILLCEQMNVGLLLSNENGRLRHTTYTHH
jgi:hypothetical protein